MAFHNDEGFSEEIRMAEDVNSHGQGIASTSAIPDWILALPDVQRSELAHAIMRSLRTSSIAKIVDQLNPLLHIDPILRLPAEITQEIFSYLDQKSLVTTTILSKPWRIQALDPHIWKHLFASEGWKADYKRVWDFEEAQRQHQRERRRERKSRARSCDAASDTELKSPRKRARDVQLSISKDDDAMILDGGSPKRSHNPSDRSTALWVEQHGLVEADEDERMEDSVLGPQSLDHDADQDPADVEQQTPYIKTVRSSSADDTIYPPIKPSLLMTDSGPSPQINWQYLYKQRRRLEENWKAGRFTNFILPHPSHPHEAHTECIYTIQYAGKHLVSGSRDKTIRIWNLDTQRLMHPPLRGHGASVLCLQFDVRPAEDIIISGGGDCSIILWQFSTGRMLKKIESAHAESVLNLRFDAKHLVTCSKDRTIKVWNRRSLLPTDDAYPIRGVSKSVLWPAHIIDVAEEVAKRALRIEPLSEYSLLMTLVGHTAAVNAIQVLDDTVVSASGDRQIKVWDLKTGMNTGKIQGHTKGIACVQFDGRRIVSGSSDVSVRIFDAVSGAEVACLRGHNDLVRTVQARFCDVKSNVKEEEAEARRIDKDWFRAKDENRVALTLTKEQWKTRNAGSRDVNDIFALGANLPPGGGGNQWARIVSGSYDESIIIWHKDGKGSWEPLHQLTQWDAILRAGGQPRNVPPPNQTHPDPRRRAHRHNADGHEAQHRPLVARAIRARRVGNQGQIPPTTDAERDDTPITANGNGAIDSQQNANAPVARAHTVGPQLHPALTIATGTPTPSQQPLPHRTAQQVNANAANAANPAQLPGTIPAAATNQQAQAAAQTQAAAAAAAVNNNNTHNQHHQRIYKLQFCSRRLLCCSMEPIIVGWDFAAGDKEIEIASEFFGEDMEG